MNVFLRRVVLPFTVMVIIWLLIGVVTIVADDFFGLYWIIESTSALHNSHLLEEAAEGEYFPLTDPIFIASEIAVGVLIFGVGSYIAAMGVERKYIPLIAVAPILSANHLLGRFIWDGSYPQPVRTVAFVCLGIYILGSFGGFALAKKE